MVFPEFAATCHFVIAEELVSKVHAPRSPLQLANPRLLTNPVAGSATVKLPAILETLHCHLMKPDVSVMLLLSVREAEKAPVYSLPSVPSHEAPVPAVEHTLTADADEAIATDMTIAAKETMRNVFTRVISLL